MNANQSQLVNRLRQEIQRMEGTVSATTNTKLTTTARNEFPWQLISAGRLHEWMVPERLHHVSAAGFASAMLARQSTEGKIVLWTGQQINIYPPGLVAFGLKPDQFLFVRTRDDRETKWVMQEALKCDGLAVVIGELTEFSFKDSRRLQLACEASRVTGFIFRHTKRPGITASQTRWQVSPLASEPVVEGMPGVGLPRWNVELLRIRNGKPSTWQVEWRAGKLLIVEPAHEGLVPLRSTGS